MNTAQAEEGLIAAGLRRCHIRTATANGSTTKEVVRSILAKLSAFTNGQPQRDDMTLLVVKVRETPRCSSTTSARRDAS